MKKNKIKKVSTVHGFERFRERTDMNQEAFNNFISSAYKHGRPINDFVKEEKFYNYLNNKMKGGKKVKVYKDYVFIFYTTSKRLITMYPVPDCFLIKDDDTPTYLYKPGFKSMCEIVNFYFA